MTPKNLVEIYTWELSSSQCVLTVPDDELLPLAVAHKDALEDSLATYRIRQSSSRHLGTKDAPHMPVLGDEGEWSCL